jgi:hypothetical protein
MTTLDQIPAYGPDTADARRCSPTPTPTDSPDRGAPTPRSDTVSAVWPGYAAAAVAFAFAAVSFYWALGGTAGLSSLGDRIEQLALSGNPMIRTLTGVTGALKVLGGLLSLALVQPWGRRLPRRLLLLMAWIGATLLTVYGTLSIINVALIMSGALTAAEPQNPTLLLWRLLLWEPWFVVWGVLLGLTAWYVRKTPISTCE